MGSFFERAEEDLRSSMKNPLDDALDFLGYTEEEFEKIVHAYGEEAFPELGVKKDDLQLYKPTGCERCGKTGYRGRTGIHELLISTADMKKMIVSKTEIAEIRKLAMQEGMRTLVQDGIMKVLKGQTDLLQLRRVTAD